MLLLTLLGVPLHLQCWFEIYWASMAARKAAQQTPMLLPSDLADANVPGHPMYSDPCSWAILRDHIYRTWTQRQIPLALRTLATMQQSIATLLHPGYQTHADRLILRSLEDGFLLLGNMDLLLSAWPATHQTQQVPPIEELAQSPPSPRH